MRNYWICRYHWPEEDPDLKSLENLVGFTRFELKFSFHRAHSVSNFWVFGNRPTDRRKLTSLMQGTITSSFTLSKSVEFTDAAKLTFAKVSLQVSVQTKWLASREWKDSYAAWLVNVSTTHHRQRRILAISASLCMLSPCVTCPWRLLALRWEEWGFLWVKVFSIATVRFAYVKTERQSSCHYLRGWQQSVRV